MTIPYQSMSDKDEDQIEQGQFPFLHLPFELQELIISIALEDEEISKVSILSSCKLIHKIAIPLLYTNIRLSSIQQTLRFLDKNSASSTYSPIHSKTYTFTLSGVPGGNTRGGRESAPSSPRRQNSRRENDRLLLASKAALLCPLLEHCTFEMFGVRHSSLLTSSDYLDQEANTFRLALSNLKHLQTFSWITPRVNHNFLGISVAVVDLAIGPMIEGLLAASTDMDESGRRRWFEKGSLKRFVHPLNQIILHHCIFPVNPYQNESFFNLFAQFHPDDQDWFLFPCLQLIVIRTANNVDSKAVAFLALIWQLRLDKFMMKNHSEVIRFQLNHSQSAKDPKIILFDTFVNSIWGPRITEELIRKQIEKFVMTSFDVEPSSSSSHNPLIRALEDSVNSMPKLHDAWKAKISKLQEWQRNEIIDRACDRVIIPSMFSPFK